MWTIDASCNKKYLTQWKEGGAQVSHSVPIKGLTTDYPFLTSVKDHVTLENHQTYGKKNVKVWWRAQSAEKSQVNADESESNTHFHMTHWVWWIVNIWGGIHVYICVSPSIRILNFESRTIECSQTYYLGVHLSWYLTMIQQRKRNYIGLESGKSGFSSRVCDHSKDREWSGFTVPDMYSLLLSQPWVQLDNWWLLPR